MKREYLKEAVARKQTNPIQSSVNIRGICGGKIGVIII